jgi:hypothetical protein
VYVLHRHYQFLCINVSQFVQKPLRKAREPSNCIDGRSEVAAILVVWWIGLAGQPRTFASRLE